MSRSRSGSRWRHTPSFRLRLFADRRVVTKILAMVLTVTFIGVAVGFFAVSRMAELDAATRKVHGNNVVLGHIASLRDDVNRARIASLAHVLENDMAKKKLYEEVFEGAVAQVDESLAQVRGEFVIPAAVRLLDEFAPAWNGYKAVLRDRFLPASREYRLSDVRLLRATEIETLTRTLYVSAEDLVKVGIKHSAAENAHAAARYRTARNTVIVLLLAGALVGLAFGAVVARMITRRLSRCVQVLEAIRSGDLTARATVDTADELGRLARALNESTAATASMVRDITENSEKLSGAAEHMFGVAAQLSTTAEQTTTQAGVVSAAAENVSVNVRTVATGAEEMGSSIREIANNAGEAARVAADAATAVRRTNDTVARLDESSAEIGDVVKLITSIAAQTNLLALNATIEAARAGDAGKGFAVVASEVKDLAQETARATENIANRVGAIQTETRSAIGAIEGIGKVVNLINQYSSTIAAAVEQQTATTGEMARNVTEAATGSREIAGSIAGVAGAADATSRGAGETRTTARELARLAGELRRSVSGYRS